MKKNGVEMKVEEENGRNEQRNGKKAVKGKKE